MDEFELTAEEEKELQEKKTNWLNEKSCSDTLKSRRVKFLKSEHPLFRFNALSVAECHLFLKAKFEWTTNRHSAFPTTDVPVPFDSATGKMVIDRILPFISTQFGFIDNDLELLDLFMVRYDASRPGLAMHSDGCLLSFNILLNATNEFIEGGTRFKNGDTIILKQGECLAHDSRVLHMGVPISSGVRYILVGFIETKRRGLFSKQMLTGRYPHD